MKRRLCHRTAALCVLFALAACDNAFLERTYMSTERGIAGLFRDLPPPAPVVDPPERGTRPRPRLGDVPAPPDIPPAGERRRRLAEMEAARAESQAVEARLVRDHAHQVEGVAPIASIVVPDGAASLSTDQTLAVGQAARALLAGPGRARVLGTAGPAGLVAAALRRAGVPEERVVPGGAPSQPGRVEIVVEP